MELYPHQAAAVEKMHNGCVLTGEPGTGKSVTAIDYYFHKACGGADDTRVMSTPRDLYVITTAKKRDTLDWEQDALHYGVFTDRENHPQGVRIVVDSWNNIAKYTEVSDAFFIFDEQRVVGSGKWTRAFVKIAKHNEWVMLSATPGDTWLDYIPVFLAHGYYKNRTEFKREHCIYNSYAKYPKVERYVSTGRLVKQRDAILVPMPYLSHTVRHTYEVPVSYDESTFDKVRKERWHVYEARPLRDVAELFAVMRKVVNSDSSRMAAIQSLMEKHPKLIVFYNFNYELEQLRTLAPSSKSSSRSTSTKQSSSRIGNDGGLNTSTVEEGSSHSTADMSTAWDAPAETRSKECLITAVPATLPGHNETNLATSVQGSDVITAAYQENQPSTSTTTAPSSSTGSNKSSGSSSSKRKGSEAFQIAEWNGHKHEPIPTTDSWVYLVQYQAGAEGWNCIETDAMAFYSLTYSYKMFHQAHGRIDRLNTPFVDLHYYILLSTSMIDRAVMKALRMKKSFNEKKSGLFATKRT